MILIRIFNLVYIFLFFSSCASVVENENVNGNSSSSLLPDLNLDNGIEVVTWNIEFFPKQGQRTIDSVYNIITGLNADIYCLQEIYNINSFLNLVDELIEYDYVISDDTDYLNLVVLYKKDNFVVRSKASLFTDSMYAVSYTHLTLPTTD